jgi:O-antigen/teichoic acid export membrane protein
MSSEPLPLERDVELTRSFRRGFIVTFSMDLVTKVLAAAITVLMIRGLSVSHYAYATLFLTIAQFAGSAAGSGVRTRYLRDEAERLSRGRGDESSDPFLSALFKGTVLIVLVGALSVPLVAVVGLGSEVGDGFTLVLYATLFAIGVSAIELGVARYQARRRFSAAGIVNVARSAALLVATAMILLTRQSALAISRWLAGSMLAVGLATVVAAGKRHLPSHVVRTRLLTPDEASLSAYYVAAAGFAYVDIIVAGALLDPRQVATLGAALRYLAIVQSPIPALAAVLRVRTSQADLVDSLAGQKAMLFSWLRRSALPATLIVGAAAALAPLVIPMIDHGRYPDSIIVFEIFLATALSGYLTAPGVSILMTQRRFAALALIYTAGLALNLIGDIAVARRFGVIGIALVSTSIYVSLDVLMTSYAIRRASAAIAASERRGGPVNSSGS